MNPMLQEIDIFAQRKGWLRWHKTRRRKLTCPACQETAVMSSRLDTASPAHKFHRFALFECPTCGTGHFPNLKPPAYEGKEAKKGERIRETAALKYYLEQGAGLLSMIEPLLPLNKGKKKSFLEVGSGYGFALHFAREALGWAASGCDPSSLARVGAKDLELEILPIYLDQNTALKTKAVDVVYSSEVIEHVINPDGFLQPIIYALKKNGVLVLTTPDIGAMQANRSLDSLLPLVSPGSHLVLFSKAGLEVTLQRAGFKYVEVLSNGDTLIAYGSNSALEFADQIDTGLAAYRQYLQQQTEKFQSNGQLFTGFCGRMIKEQINSANYSKAQDNLKQLASHWKKTYKINLLDPSELVFPDPDELDFEEFARKIPFNQITTLYHAGILALNYLKKPTKALDYFNAAVRCEVVLQSALLKVNVVDLESQILAGLANALAIGISANENLAQAADRLQQSELKDIPEQCKIAYFNAKLDVFSVAANTGQWDIARSLADAISKALIDQKITSDRDRSAVVGLAMLALNHAFDRKNGLFWLNKALHNSPRSDPWKSLFNIWGDHAAVRGAELFSSGGKKQLSTEQNQIINGLLARSAKPADLGTLLALTEITANYDHKLADKLFKRAAKLVAKKAEQDMTLLVDGTQVKIFLSPETLPKLLGLWRKQIEELANNYGQQSLQFALGLDDLNRNQDPVSSFIWLEKAQIGTDATIATEAGTALDIAKAQIRETIINSSGEGDYKKIEALLHLLPDDDNEPQTIYAMAMYWLNHKNNPKTAAKHFALTAELTDNNSLRDQANFHRALAMTRFGDTKGAKQVALELFGDENNPNTTSLLFDRKRELEDAIQQKGAG
ncbi:MAG: class I SAM-dependent methyltransferase [Robiginitomaculum sp.]|nr:class I SAM-dependent methyltransferase [Robiginitomaculum sp.]